MKNMKKAQQIPIDDEVIYIDNNFKKNKNKYEKLIRKKPKFMCINDNVDFNYNLDKIDTDLYNFFQEYFPDVSSFENEDGLKYYK
jgi:hypothetical protein